MTDSKKEVTNETLEKLLKLVEKDDAYIFNEDEVKVLKKVIDFYVSLESLGRLGKGFRAVIVWFGAMAATWFAIREALQAFIRAQAGGP